MNRSRLTRCLHGLLALAVVHQLLVSLFMEAPEPGHIHQGIGGTLFEFHEIGGLTSLGVVVIFWLWSLIRTGETPPGRLLPWLSAAGWSVLREDLRHQWKSLRAGEGPAYEPDGPLAGAVHGLGLLAVTGMVITGALWWLNKGAPGWSGEMAGIAKETHETLAPLVWTYLMGHAGMALWHSWRGHGAIRNMFTCRATPAATREES